MRDVQVHDWQAEKGEPPRFVLSPAFRALAFSLVLGVAWLQTPASHAQEDMEVKTRDEIIEEAIKAPTKDFETNARGNNRQYCEIIVNESGEIHPRPGTNTLSSLYAGGRAGRAQVLATNSSFRISIDPPLGFRLAPPNGNDGAIFTTSYSASGATNFSNQPGIIAQRIKRGVTNIEAHLTADRGQSPFPAGQYSAEIVMRCE